MFDLRAPQDTFFDAEGPETAVNESGNMFGYALWIPGALHPISNGQAEIMRSMAGFA